MPDRVDGREETQSERDDDRVPRRLLYCLIPRDLAPRLHETLRRHFAPDPTIEVVVQRRTADRRAARNRRAPDRQTAPATFGPPAHAPKQDSRRIRNIAGRRLGERRAALLAVDDGPPLPRKARAHAHRLTFVERLEPSTQQLEDQDAARLIMRIQSGDRDAFADLYMRYFDRVYSYLRLLLRDPHEAEDLAQQVFVSVLQALPRYEHRRSFWVWLVVVLRNHALNAIRQRNRVELTAPGDLDRQLERCNSQDADLNALGWISDRELVMFVERLPLAQRQVLLLRFMLDLSTSEIAELLERSPADVRMLQHRALAFLRTRLAALGRDSGRARPVPWRRLVVKAHVIRSRRAALLP
jgi:RNA polymerase sigma-70 factor (ECF subfamily)